jgi:hypothetical protein
MVNKVYIYCTPFQFEPIITPGNERLIHHLVIQRCKGDFPNLNHAQGECFLSWPKGWPVCSEIFIAWATGGGVGFTNTFLIKKNTFIFTHVYVEYFNSLNLMKQPFYKEK